MLAGEFSRIPADKLKFTLCLLGGSQTVLGRNVHDETGHSAQLPATQSW